MFPSQSPLRVPVDQFSDAPTHSGGRRRVRWGQVALLAPGLAVALLAGTAGVRLGLVAGALLTATSILTGFTFSMAVVFWNKTIDARRDPRFSTSADALNEIDTMRVHLIYTVGVGVATVLITTLYLLFSGLDPRPGDFLNAVAAAGTSVAAGLVVYLITLVVASLYRFNRAVLLLRR